jgi:hypothetical protein
MFQHVSDPTQKIRSGVVQWHDGMIRMTLMAQGMPGVTMVSAKNDKYEFLVTKDDAVNGSWKLGKVGRSDGKSPNGISPLFCSVNYQCAYPLSSIFGDSPEAILELPGIQFSISPDGDESRATILARRDTDPAQSGQKQRVDYEFTIDPRKRCCVISASASVDGRRWLLSRRTMTGSGADAYCRAITYELWDLNGPKVTDIVTTFEQSRSETNHDGSLFHLNGYGITSELDALPGGDSRLWIVALAAGALLIAIRMVMARRRLQA